MTDSEAKRIDAGLRLWYTSKHVFQTRCEQKFVEKPALPACYEKLN